jgi:hypothetical protein
MSALLILIAFTDVSVAASPASTSDDVSRVRIESGWVGLGTPTTVVVDLVRTARGFSDGKRDVDSALVAGLRARLRAPAVRALPSSLAALYRSFWTDDFPEVDVKVTLRSGRVLHANTRNQHDYMLPWDVDGRTTYDMDLSSIVAKLLPPGAVNRLRLDGARFRAPSSLP